MMSTTIFRYAFLTLLLLFVFSWKPGYSISTNHIDSLLVVVNSGEYADSLVLDAYFKLAWELKSVDPVVSLTYAREGLSIAERLNNKSKIADAYSHIGVIYWQMGSFRMALDYHMQALGLFSELQDETGIARSNTNIGIIFTDQGYYEKAMEYFYRALLLYEKNDHSTGMAILLNNLGLLSEYQNEYDLAEKYHLQSLEIKERTGDIKGIAYSYNNLGLVYQGKKMMDEAREYFMKALQIREQLNDKREIATTVSNLGYLYYLADDNENAREYLKRALDLYYEVNDKSGIARSLNYLGRLNVKTEETFAAMNFFNQSLELSKEVGMKRMVAQNYQQLASLMAKMGDYRQAFLFQELYIKMNDSIYTEDSKRKAVELQLMFDREKKESEMQLAEQITFLSTQKDRLLKNFFIAGVVLIIVTLFLLYNRFLVAKNANQLLEKQKQEISKTNDKLVSLNQNLLEQKQKTEELNHQLHHSNKKLKESEKHLIEINSTKDKFFSIISHDLRNPFAAIVSFSRILKRDMENLTADELRELALELDKSVLKINNLLENLLQWSRAQTGKIRYEPEYIAIHEIVKDNLALFKNNAKEKKIVLVDKVDDDTPVWADRNMTDTVIRNLLSNALKYTGQGGRIVLKSEMKEGTVFISIEDNGVGMSEESQKKIFRVDTLHSTYGTMDEKGSGLGLLLCKEFVEKQGGKISFKSQKDKGSEFTFSLPLEPGR
jgi:signal transduction histidine kinase/Flp pilus assembly protein TadD